MFVNFADIPGTKNLMLDFLYEFENVEKFGLKNFRDSSVLENQIRNTADKEFPQRNKLVEIIKNQYAGFNVSQQTKKNINSLLSNKTVAIVAAQQIGLFGGPLKFFYKIFTAIKLAKKLNETFDEYNFVPIFWLESEDHDFEKAHKTYTYAYDKTIKKIAYYDALPLDENRGSVGELILGKSILDAINELKQILKPSAYTEQLLQLLTDSYSEKSKFKNAFRQLLTELFDDYGLIIFDANYPEVKFLVKELFKKSIEKHKELAVSGIDRAAELEEFYHAQIKIHPVNLYFNDDSGRHRIEVHEKGFKIGHKRKIWKKDEILELIEEQPQRFSPDVIFRPLMQDSIFPTAIMITGEDEMNYFPQIVPYYEYFGLETPLLYPRASVTLNETYLENKINNYGLTYKQLFLFDEQELTQNLIYANDKHNVEKIFAQTASDIDLTMDILSERLAEIDGKLEKAALEVKDGIYKLLQILNEKALNSNDVRRQHVYRHIKALRNQFFPNGKLQEDIINFSYFANQYGLDILKFIFDEISVSKFEHQIITI